MTTFDFARDARRCSALAAAATRRAERTARDAETWYLLARHQFREAAWLTRRPELWGKDRSPAITEEYARELVRLGDTFVRSSFSATERAADYRELAARYREMARPPQACGITGCDCHEYAGR